MASIYPKRGRLYFRLKVGPKWVGVATEFRVGQERQARAMLDRLEAQRAAGERLDARTGPPTVASWFPRWLSARKAHVMTWRNDDGVMRLHVLPALGPLRLDHVRPKHLVDLVREWRARTGERAMAPKSIYNAYATVSAFFRDAALEDLVATSPCVLTQHQLGPKMDKDLEWRPTAKFSRAELEQLISDQRVPLDRRVFYALEGVAGLRTGEVSGLLWRNALVPVPEHRDSLDMLHVAFGYDRPFPKGAVARPVPVHPALASLLAEWRLTGWRRFMGRDPRPDDLVVPLPPDAVSRKGRWRPRQFVRKWFVRDLETLGLRHRRGHDLRRSFISLARSDGAEKGILDRVTHKPPREVIEGYTSYEWPVVCREVLKLQVRRLDLGKVLEMPRAMAVGDRATRLLPGETSQRGTAVALPGLEPRERSSGESESARFSPSIPGASAPEEPLAAADNLGSGLSSGSTVASALGELLELGSSALEADHPAMRRAAAALKGRGW